MLTSFSRVSHELLTSLSRVAHLVDVVEVGALLGPVAVAHGDSVLGEFGQTDDDHAALFPHHLPEVSHCVGQRALGGDVGRVPGVVVRLKEQHTQKEIILC